ncbi:MAG: TIGR00730 family Rossman fold protein [Saprospiraceae bacterium]|nr:TIGR00730 family Rossman fold protein [Saprospiraceae bacterium]
MSPRSEKLLVPKEGRFLSGPRSRLKELGFAIEVFFQFIRGFRKLHFVGPCITVFGSARFKDGHPHFELAEKVGAAIAKAGFTTMTGGGPGIMEGANKGAFEAGGRSVGCNIVLPYEQDPNKYMQTWVDFDHFFVRKVLLLKYSYAFIILPGGWGTMDELFETLTLIQTGIIEKFPVVVMGKEYFAPLLAWITKMVEEGTISEEDLEYVVVTDEIFDAMEHIKKFIRQNYKIKRKKSWWLFER